MPYGTPAALNTFRLGAYQLEAFAPEEIEDELKAQWKFWFFADGTYVPQPGIVTMPPLSLSFKLNGPEALAASMLLRALATTASTTPIRLRWGQLPPAASVPNPTGAGNLFNPGGLSGNFLDLDGFVLSARRTIRQKILTMTVSFRPVVDHARTPGAGSTLGPTFTDDQTPLVLDAIAQANASLTVIQQATATINGITAQANAALQPLNDVMAAVESTVSDAQSAISAAGSLAAMPVNVASSVAHEAASALSLFPTAVQTFKQQVLAPPAALVTGTPALLLNAAGLQALAATNDLEDQTRTIATTFPPIAGRYVTRQGDTLAGLAAIFKVTIAAIVAVNPGLSAATLAPGKTINIPRGT